jgi:hypothetical protein
MERVLLWLDEIDDWCTLWLHDPSRVRRLALKVGLAAAVALGVVHGPASAAGVVDTLGGLAAASVALWSGCAVFELRRRPAGNGSRRLA